MPKGQEFERQICKQFSLWISEGKRDDVFWRTSGSGARSTSRMKKQISTENSAGDIGYIDSIGKPFIDKFLVEIKRGYSSEIELLGSIDGKKEPLLLKWFNKAEEERKNAGRDFTLLITKRNHKSSCIWFNKATIIFFEDYCGIMKSYKYKYKYGSIYYPKDGIELYTMLLGDWFSWVSPGMFENEG